MLLDIVQQRTGTEQKGKLILIYKLRIKINICSCCLVPFVPILKTCNISIKNTTYNNKKSYIINYNSIKDFPETYIEKETGLVVKYSNSEQF